MFEFRWIQLGINENPPSHAIPIQGQLATEFRVLQVRQVQNGFEVSNELQPPIWGEWEDIPMEFQPKLKGDES